MVKPGEVMAELGIGRQKLRDMVALGALRPVRFKDRRGRPVGYSYFRRAEVAGLMERMGVKS